MSNITLKLINNNVNIAVNGCSASVSIIDASGNITSAVPVMNHRPYESDRKALVRSLYIQSYNSELVMEDEERELYRALTLKMAADLNDGDNAYYVGEYCEVRENNKGIEGWVDVSRVDGKVVSVGVGIEVEGDVWSHHYDVSNGPVPFNAPLYTNNEFLAIMSKTVDYAIANNLI